jgi:hypothetical protein
MIAAGVWRALQGGAVPTQRAIFLWFHHYVDVLGFTVDWEHRFEPHLPVFMSIVRDGMQIYLTQHSGDCQVGGLVHFVIPDVDIWHREFRGRAANDTEAPNDDLGFRNMTVTDPDGNQLRFMEPSSKEALGP